MPDICRYSVWALALVVLGSKATVAQPSDSQVRITLTDAVRLSVSQGEASRLASGERASVVGRARAEAQWENPSVEIRRENDGAPIPRDDFVSVTLPVDFNGRRLAYRSALKAARERGIADSAAIVQTAQFETARIWWEVWVATESERALALQAARLGELARYDSIRAAEGEASGVAALRTRLEAERARLESAHSAASAAHTRADLATLIGLSNGELLYADSSGSGAMSPLPSEDAAIEAALRDRPDVNAARAAVRESEGNRTAERRGSLPDIALSGGYKGTGGYSTAMFGVVVTPPFLNANGGNRERAAGELLIAESERRVAELRAENEVRASLAKARVMDDASGYMGGDFAVRALRVVESAEVAYREGAATLTELLEAHRASTDAVLVGIRALADRAIARLELRLAMGAPLLDSQ